MSKPVVRGAEIERPDSAGFRGDLVAGEPQVADHQVEARGNRLWR